MEYLVQSDSGLSGLINLGNTCYMNAVIQCLSNTKPLTDFILSYGYRRYLRNKHRQEDVGNLLIVQFDKLLTGIWSDNYTIRPSSFKSALIHKKMSYQLPTQEDAHEFLQFLMENLHSEISREVEVKINYNQSIIEYIKLKKKLMVSKEENMNDDVVKELEKEYMEVKQKYHNHILTIKAMSSWKDEFTKNYSEIIKMLYGQIISTIVCEECNYTSYKFDSFSTLSVDIVSEQCSLKECFNYVNAEEKMENWKCDKCAKKVKSNKSISLWSLPEILIIHLKRFKVEGNSYKKNKSYVKFPINNFDISDYVNKYQTNDSSKYGLYAIVNHMGNMSNGHYTSYCKNPNNSWYEYDDKNVLEIDIDKIVSPYAYILFYRRMENLPE